MHALPAPLGVALRDDAVSSAGWYPLPWYCVLHRTAQEVAGAGTELARRIGFMATHSDAKGIYRFVLSFVDTGTILRHADRVLSLYFEGPRIAVEPISRTEATLKIEDCHGADASVWANIVGASEALIEVSGGKDGRVTVLDGGGDEARVSLRAEWRR